ncbi:MAG TPA: tetratricopeptide repeat protein [Phycisphaerae bacterium]|nr:tetratricopeptide repeat protein [Phycisphaerae bacterium]
MAKKKRLNSRMLVLLGVMAAILIICLTYIYFRSLPQNPEFYANKAAQLMSAPQKNYLEAINCLRLAAEYSSGIKRNEYLYRQAELMLEYASRGVDLDDADREQAYSSGLGLLQKILQSDENYVPARKLLAQHRWAIAVRARQWHLWENYIQQMDKLIEAEDTAENYFRRGYAKSALAMTDPSFNDAAIEDFNKAIELDKEKLQYRIALARFYELIKDTASAELTYKKSMEANPDKADIRIEYANFLRRKNENKLAQRVIIDAIKCEPNNAAGYVAMAEMALAEKDYKTAQNALEKAKKIDPAMVYAYYYQANIARAQKRLKDAADALREGLSAVENRDMTSESGKKLDANKAKALLNYWLADIMLDIYQTSNDPKEREAALQEAKACNTVLLKLSPDDPRQLKIDGRLAMIGQNYAKAKDCFEHSLEMETDLRTAAWLINIYRVLNLPTRGETLSKKILAVPGEEDNVYFLLRYAEFRIDANDFTKATEYLSQVLAKEPDNRQAQELMAAIELVRAKRIENQKISPIARALLLRKAENFVVLNKLEQAQNILESLLRSNPKDMVVMSRLLSVYTQNGQTEKAAGTIDASLAKNPNNEDLKRWKALLNEKSPEKRCDIELNFAGKIQDPLNRALSSWSICKRYGQEKSAAKYLAEARKIKPDNQIVIEGYFLQALANKDYELARKEIEPLEKRDPLDWNLYMGRLLYAQNNFESAATYLQGALKYQSYNQPARLMLADCFLQLNETEKAKQEFQRCFSNDSKDIRAMVGLAKIAMATHNVEEHDRWVELAYNYPEGKVDSYIREEYLRMNVDNKNPAQAIETRERLFEKEPSNLENALRLAFLYERKKDIAKAREKFEYIYANVADKISFAPLLAEFYMRQKETTKADELFNSLIKQAKTANDKIAAYVAYGSFLSGMDQQAAMSMFEKAKSIDPNNTMPYKALSNLLGVQAIQLSQQGKLKDTQQKWQAAVKQLQEVIRMTPEDKQVRQTLYRIYIDAQMYKDAEDGFTMLVHEDPNDVRARLGLGLTYLREGKTGKAVTEFKNVIEMTPDNPDAYAFRAEAYKSQGDLVMAIADLKRACQLSSQMLLRMDLANLYLANDQSDMAEVVYSEIIDTPSTDKYFPAYQQLLRIGLAQQKWPLVEKICNKGEKLFPESPLFCLTRAEMWNRRDNQQSMLEFLNKAVKIAPTDSVVVGAYFKGLMEGRKYDALLKVADYYQNQANFVSLSHAYRGMVLAARKDAGALNEFLEALKIAEKSTDVLNTVGMMAQVYGKAEILKLADNIIAAKPDNWQIFMLLGNYCVELDGYKQAHGYYIKALNLAGDVNSRVAVLLQMAHMYEITRDYESVEKTYLAILNMDANNTVALNNLAYLYVDIMKRPDKAMPMIERAMTLMPGNLNLMDTYGWVLAKNGDYNKASQQLSEVVRRGKAGPESLYHMGYVLERTNQMREARDYYRRSLELVADKKSKMYAEIAEAYNRVENELKKRSEVK